MKLQSTVFAVSLAVLAALNLSAQTSSSSTPSKASSSSGGDRYEINLFGGGHFYKGQSQNPQQDLVNGGVAGIRVVENLWNYISLEQTGMLHGVANVQYRIPNSSNLYAMGARLRQFHFNPVFHFKPREARVRPFVTAGVGFDYFGITDDARRQVGSGINTPFQQPVNLASQFKPSVNFGGGIKGKLTDRIGLRFDVRAFASGSPDFGVPGVGPAGAITYTGESPLWSTQATGGVTFYLGTINAAPVCNWSTGVIDPATRTVWVGEGATYQLPVNTTCLGVTPKYKWTVDGKPVAGDAMVAIKELNTGDHQVKAVVEADTTKVTDRKTKNWLVKNPIAATERTANLTVKQPVVEIKSITMDPRTLNLNSTSAVTSVIFFDGPPAGDEYTVVYTVTDGKLSAGRPNGVVHVGPDGRSAALNPGNSVKISPDGRTLEEKVLLKPGNTTGYVNYSTEGITLQPGGPSKNIEIEVTVRDKDGKVIGRMVPADGNRGATIMAPPAPAAAPAPAPAKPQPMQLDDVIFSKGSARTNNCGKRILDQAYERAAAMGDYDVLLVGHYDAVEKNIKVRDPKSKKTRTLDEERVLQVAAVLSAGTEPCKRLEARRIKVAYVGGEQLSPFKTSLCEATVKERASGKISAADGNAKNRRVEIWLVPKSGPMPNGIAGIQDAPASDIQSKGCPK